MIDDERRDGSDVRQDHKELVGQILIASLQPDLDCLRQPKSKSGDEGPQWTPARQHRAGNRKKAATGDHVIDERIDLNDGKICASEAGCDPAEKDTGSLPQLDGNPQRPRDLGAFAAGSDFKPERRPIEHPAGRNG